MKPLRSRTWSSPLRSRTQEILVIVTVSKWRGAGSMPNMEDSECSIRFDYSWLVPGVYPPNSPIYVLDSRIMVSRWEKCVPSLCVYIYMRIYIYIQIRTFFLGGFMPLGWTLRKTASMDGGFDLKNLSDPPPSCCCHTLWLHLTWGSGANRLQVNIYSS